ncbi:hypothetical protein SLT36_10455 [Aminobacter sp. BA135]|uniref:hypothetical protein n=1 Tax=Aminobacter sp. BA135 TaxID=537596 RepID=UPI003D7A6CDC
MERCRICSRLLNFDQDPLSGDSGGDCWGCIGKIEADSGWAPTTSFIADEIEEGWREQDGTAKSQAFFVNDAEWQRKVAAGYKPWFDRRLSHCRVRGFDHFPDWPWAEDGKQPSYDICLCCGVQFGYEDETANGCYASRKNWVETRQCGFWSLPTMKPPPDWSPSRQLRQVPADFRSPDDERLVVLASEHESKGLHLSIRPRLP